MNEKLVETPSLDALVADPGRVHDLPGPVAHHLLIQLTALLPLLVAHAHTALTTEPAPHDDRLLTVDEAATKLGLTKDYLYRHAYAFAFSVRVGPKQLRFSLNGIERYIRQRRACLNSRIDIKT